MSAAQIDFQAYLTFLVSQRERFSVPGLGTFVWHLERSHVDPKGGSISPPRPILKFEPGLRYQSETVAFLRDYFTLTRAEAENLLKEIGRLASAYLRAASEIDLWRIGKLKRVGGIYKFEPAENATLPIALDLGEVSLRAGGTPAVAPLSAAPASPTSASPAAKAKPSKTKDTPPAPKTAPERPRARPVEEEEQEADTHISPQPSRKRNWIPLISGIVIVVSLLVAATVWLMRRRQPPAPVEITLSPSKSTPAATEAPKNPTPAPSSSPSSDKPSPKTPTAPPTKAEMPAKPVEKTETSPKPASKSTPPPPQTQPTPPPSGPKYYIIIGSYPSRAEAETQAQRFSGYTIEYLPGKDPGWVRLGLLVSGDKAAAQRKLREVKAQVPDAWLYTAP